MSPLAGLGVEIVRVESMWFLHALQKLPDVVHLVAVDTVARHVGEVAELHGQGAELGEDAGAAARPAVVLAAL